jgi:hypothetical protein
VRLAAHTPFSVSNSKFEPLTPGISDSDVIPVELPPTDQQTRFELYAGYARAYVFVLLNQVTRHIGIGTFQPRFDQSLIRQSEIVDVGSPT